MSNALRAAAPAALLRVALSARTCQCRAARRRPRAGVAARCVAVGSALGAPFSQQYIEIPAKANFYQLSDTIAASLQSSPQVVLRAGGKGAALRVLRICTFVDQDLRKTNGFLPGFGWLVLRPGRYSSAREPGSGHLLATATRMLEPPPAEGEAPAAPAAVVLRRDSDVGDLAAHVAQGLGGGAPWVPFRLVGEAPADCVWQIVLAAQKLLREDCAGPAARSGRLVLAPSIGMSLSPSSLSREELMASVCRWTEPASPLPGPIHARMRHRPGFLQKHEWVGVGFKDD
mmetsp:Transcript_139885/g.389871  ORF Transcript_139885/g.389871 Transcript_139885/m.389871 type:complete len:287 (-) Transcript_139885:54-914(-)